MRARADEFESWCCLTMEMLRTAEPIAGRGRCVGCFRPQADCFCDAIPSIDNRTHVLILQHRRERFHPFNTARMVHTALRKSSLLVDHTPGLAARVVLKPRAGLLYPGPGAILIDDLPPAERPEQLVVVDGTWHHAKTVVRDLRPLHDLPRYRLAPAEPSRYRVRREPSAMFLSTVEATVAALRALEPETRGLDQLLAAFDCMVERQLAHPSRLLTNSTAGDLAGMRSQNNDSSYFASREGLGPELARLETVILRAAGGLAQNPAENATMAVFNGIPVIDKRLAAQCRHAAAGAAATFLAALLGDLNHVVVIYGESTAGEPGCKHTSRLPVYWTAQRLGTGECFAQAIEPPAPLPATLFDHFELPRDVFAGALSLDQAGQAWSAFRRPGDVLTAYNSSTVRLLAQLTGQPTPCLVLRSIDFNPHRRYSTLDVLIAGEALTVAPIQHPGRAGRRLASAVALVEHLRAMSMVVAG